jgi:hypothetical protein
MGLGCCLQAMRCQRSPAASNTASDSVSGRRKQMTMQSDKGGGLSTNLAVQLGILAIVVTVLLHGHRHSVVSMIASQYFW